MIKKYFAMTIIAASVSLAACSSDDDEVVVVDPDTVVVTGDGTAYDLIVGTGNHTTLVGLINGAGLDATLDAVDAVFTVFAPDDDAFIAYDAAVAAGVATPDDDTDDLTALADFTDAQVSRILLNHVVNGSFATLEDAAVLSTRAVANDAVVPALVAQTLSVSIDAVGNTSVTAIGGDPVLVDATTLTGTEADAVEQDIVHSVGTILAPSDLPAAEEVVVDPGNGGGDTGTFATLVGDDYTIAVAALDAAYGAGTFDNAAWTLFLPSDAMLAAASPAITVLTADQINGHLHTAALNEADLAAVATGAGTILSASSTPTSIAITTDGEGATLVGGFSVTYIGAVAADAAAETSGGAQVYAIDGILPAVE